MRTGTVGPITNDGVSRRLAAILAADMVGYSRLMGDDEAGTIARQKAHRTELIDPKIAEHGGRVVKTTGDGLLAEFGSAVDAVLCAVEIQRAMVGREAEVSEDRRIVYRVGINVGEIVIDGDDILGDGVNVAARLEALAEPGGIRISDAVFKNVRGKLDLGFADLGPQKVKNIAEPVPTFRVLLDPGDTGKLLPAPRLRGKIGRWIVAAAVLLALVVTTALVWQPWSGDGNNTLNADWKARLKKRLPNRPSIAVLPFENRSVDKAQEYFADAVTEDLITGLSKVSGIFNVSSVSTLRFKGQSPTARTVAEAVGVRYVLFGTVRRAGDKLLITAQLVDALEGRPVWAQRFDRETKELFNVQQEITQRLVRTLAVALKASEAERVYQRHTSNIDAYDLFLRARKMVLTPSRKNVEFAEQLFKKVIELDPKFAGGYAGLSLNYSMKARFRFGTDPVKERKLSLELARKAVSVDPNFSWSYIALGGAYLAQRDPDAAVDAVRQALVIQPNGYEENLWMGFYAHFAGQPALAISHLEIADRISPVDTVRKLSFMAMAYYMNRNYRKSVAIWERRIQKYSVGNPISYVFMCGALAHLKRQNEAAECAAKYRQLNPNFRLSRWGYVNLYKRAGDRKTLLDGAIMAGMPN